MFSRPAATCGRRECAFVGISQYRIQWEIGCQARGKKSFGYQARKTRTAFHGETFHHTLPNCTGSILRPFRRDELYESSFETGKVRDSHSSSLRNRGYLVDARSNAATGVHRREQKNSKQIEGHARVMWQHPPPAGRFGRHARNQW